jgi:capsid assembly protease
MIRDLNWARDRLFGRPLLIRAEYADHLVTGLQEAMRRRGSTVKPAMIEDDSQQQQPRPRNYRIANGIALLPVHGVLVKRAGQITPDSTELQSYQRITAGLREARGDNRVRGILLDVDTPGGEAGGIFDLADEVRATARDKPVWAIANDDALSAGYAIAAATNRIWITNTGAAGSVGVVALHLDQSGFDEKEGFHYTYIYRGQHKIDAHAHGPLTDMATEAIRGEVERLYDMLINNVAKHRGNMSTSALRETEAAIYAGQLAVARGLADQVGTLDQAHAAMAEQIAPRARSAFAQTTGTRSANMEDDPNLPETTQAPPPADNVVNLDQVRSAAIAEARHQAGEIAALCTLAGYPEASAEHINSGASLEAVRAALQVRKAGDSAKRQVEALDTSAVRSDQLAELNAATSKFFTATQARQ